MEHKKTKEKKNVKNHLRKFANFSSFFLIGPKTTAFTVAALLQPPLHIDGKG